MSYDVHPLVRLKHFLDDGFSDPFVFTQKFFLWSRDIEEEYIIHIIH